MPEYAIRKSISILIPVAFGIWYALSDSVHDADMILAMSIFAATPFGRPARRPGSTRDHDPDSRSKEHVMSVLSHEFRTPLSIILGYADILRLEIDDSRKEPVEAIIRSGRQLLSTLNSILEWIEISEDRQILRRSSFDLGLVFDDLVASHRARAVQKGLRLVCIAPAGAILMNSDEDRIGRIMGYLLDNAVKFTSKGEVRISLSSSSDRVSITISDTGIGVDEGRLTELSSPFIQGSRGDDRKYGGVGLGLTLATEGIRLLGGSIRVLNRPEGGTRVEISIPRTLPGAVRKVA